MEVLVALGVAAFVAGLVGWFWPIRRKSPTSTMLFVMFVVPVWWLGGGLVGLTMIAARIAAQLAYSRRQRSL